jgi:8-oxo-dGTP pyrophosphatase MutT (NUDIX family)
VDERRANGERILAAISRACTHVLVGLPSTIKNPCVVRLHEFYRDRAAPVAQDVLPAAFAAVRNPAGQILLVQRLDDHNWELPGGRIEVGESVMQALTREVVEESGIMIELTGLAGVYSDPSHVLVDPGDVVHQQLALCFHATPASVDPGEKPRPDGIETIAAAWFHRADTPHLAMHPAVRLRLEHAIEAPDHPYWE